MYCEALVGISTQEKGASESQESRKYDSKACLVLYYSYWVSDSDTIGVIASVIKIEYHFLVKQSMEQKKRA